MSDRPRFELAWQTAPEPGPTMHVTLFDAEFPPHYIRAVGHGAHEPDTLLNLWLTLVDRNEPPEAIAFVAAEFTRRTRKAPDRSF